ncbi:3-oxoacyl-[acyl-carrier-protein] synthase III C-terminal domain-containing protein [Alkalinema sp. FACHB-956]|uniref:3-oxoacyl-[acyl-carrier-protein] synthase III C-terminal domain-containing protein n=1 Tax=Alkalinema sp. FACHB-956 TaxID=2692768 RepID=UPI0016863D94|nr:3-oxoacyl-[acyl-carrier-protein] synthase III C-terminal domain-containing protein [Alkalinema sp. FACHB-956]MBD2328049.1 3-oxoacyl-ACP synthase [Alkalinema sp. FACHB-956]
MTMPSVGIRSLAVSFPSTIRTNQYWLDKFPDLVSPGQRSTRLPQPLELSENPSGLEIWLQAIVPYLADPFRGSVARRVLAEQESSQALESQAAQAALQAAELQPEQIDLAIVASLFPDEVGPGTAARLAQSLGLICPAWNLESTCASALVALQTAQSLIQTGIYHNILIIVSHIGSRSVNDRDTLAWSMGDGAGAWVVSPVAPSQGILGTYILSTATTTGAYVHEWGMDEQGQPRIQTRTGNNVSRLAEIAAETMQQCCQAALAAAGVGLEEIQLFAINTPTAWYAEVFAQALGVESDRVMNLYPDYGNIGPVFPMANLDHAARAGKIRDNDLVLIYANGAGATAAATVMRWGAVALAAESGQEVTRECPPTPILSTASISTASISTASTSTTSTDQSDRVASLLSLSLADRASAITIYLIEWLAQARQLSPDQLNGTILLSTLLDSLMAIVLRSQLETDFQVRVPMEKFFGEQTIDHLSQYLMDQLSIVELIKNPAIQPELSQANDREVMIL